MRVVAIVPNKNHCSWWRIEKPFEFLKNYGVDTEICWLDSNEMPTVDIEGAVVVLHRLVINGGEENQAYAWIKKLRSKHPKKIVYELDDDTITVNFIEHMNACGRSSMISLSQLEAELWRQIAIVQACDEVTVTTEKLKDAVKTITTMPIHVIPNSLDLAWYKHKLQPNSPYQNIKGDILQPITIGWAGGLRPNKDFELLTKAWTYIDQKYSNVRFVIAGWQADPLWDAVDYDKIIKIPWASIDEWPRSMQIDIGCIPLAPTGFNRCKSPIKAIEYAMAGALPITSETVYGLSGLDLPIATSSIGWQYQLEYFINNYLDRQLTVRRIQDHIASKYSLKDNFMNWYLAYES